MSPQLFLAIALWGCGSEAPPAEPARRPDGAAAVVSPAVETPEEAVAQAAAPGPVVVTASFPVDWMVARLAGDAVTRRTLAVAGIDPPEQRPDPDALAVLAEAELLVAHGAGYEGWLATAALPSVTVRAADRIATREVPGGHSHRHGSGPAHSHAGRDPHSWMDPTALAAEAEVVADALTALVPDAKADIAARLAALRAELEALDTALRAATTPLQGRALAANHPAFAYLAARYGLDIASLDLDPETAPDKAGLARVAAFARAPGAVLLWEAPPSEDVRAALPASLVHLVLDPLEQPGADGVYDPVAAGHRNAAALAALPPHP